jgi:hypothetical protein
MPHSGSLQVENYQLFLMSVSNPKPPLGSRVALTDTRGVIRY